MPSVRSEEHCCALLADSFAAYFMDRQHHTLVFWTLILHLPMSASIQNPSENSMTYLFNAGLQKYFIVLDPAILSLRTSSMQTP